VNQNSKNYHRRRKFTKIVAETGDLRLAQTSVYPHQSHWPAQQLECAEKRLTAPAVVKTILKVWKDKGLTLEKASERHLKIMLSNSKRVKASDVLKAVEMVYKGNQVPGFSYDKDENIGKSILQIFVDQRKERGLSLPENENLEA